MNVNDAVRELRRKEKDAAPQDRSKSGEPCKQEFPRGRFL